MPPPNKPISTIDNSVYIERLITKEGQMLVPQRGTLSKCAIRYRDFLYEIQQLLLSTAGNNDPTEEVEEKERQIITTTTMDKINKIKKELIAELKLHNLEMAKIALSSKAKRSELQHYDKTSLDTHGSIVKIKREIGALKDKLEYERKVRKNREEYEELAKMASKREAAFVTKRKLERVYSDIQDLEGKEEVADGMIEMRRKQFRGLMQNIFDLKNSLEEDEARKDLEKELDGTCSGVGGGNNEDADKKAHDDNDLYGDL